MQVMPSLFSGESMTKQLSFGIRGQEVGAFNRLARKEQEGLVAEPPM